MIAFIHRSLRCDFARLTQIVGPFLGLLFVLLFFSLHAEVRSSFLSTGNFQTVASQTVIVAVAALGMTLIIISGGIDLSVGSVIALTGVIVAVLLQSGCAPSVALSAAIAAGGLLGFLNGLVIAWLRLPPFIVTLGMLGIARGAAKWLAHNETVNTAATWINLLAARTPKPAWLLVSPGVWMTLTLAALLAVMLRSSVFGRWIFALGSNEVAARLSGLRVDAIKVIVYVVAGLCFGLAGALQFARLEQADPTVAQGAELDVIAAVVIGGGSLTGGKGSILGSIVGALIMAFLRNGSQQMAWPDYVEEIIIGSVIVIAVALDQLHQRRAVLR